jgi:hypothetical protein
MTATGCHARPVTISDRIRNPDIELARRWRGVEKSTIPGAKQELAELAGAPPILLPVRPVQVLVFSCPHCRARHDIPSDLVGRTVRNCNCGMVWAPVTAVTE